MENTKLFSVREAADYIGVHIETLRRWDREGKLIAVRVGKSNHRRYEQKTLEKFKRGEDTPNHPTSIYADREIDFHSSAVPDAMYFTKIVLAIAEKVEKFVDCELIDGPYDKNRDIVGYQIGKYNKRYRVYIQCKHVRDISESILKKEIDGLSQHIVDTTIAKPSKIIFALSTKVNASIRDNIKLYVERLLGIAQSNVVFWCPAELDLRIKGERSILERFILTGPAVNPIPGAAFKDPNIKQEYEDSIKRKLARSSQLIQNRQFPEAEEHLLVFLGKIPEEEKYAKERAKAYNNLGLCYKWNGNHTEDYQKALEAFNKALDLDPALTKAQCNLVNTLLLTKNKENDNKAWDLISKLWKDVGPEDEFIIITYIQTYSIKFGKEKGLEEASKISRDLLEAGKSELVENIGFWHFLASTYFFTNQLDKAQDLITKILSQNKYDVDAVYLQAMIKMRNAKQGSTEFDDFLENYKNSQEIREVEALLREAYQLAREEKRYDLLPEIYHNWDVCRLWLWKTSGEKLEMLEYPLAESTKIDTHKISKIPERLLSKDYEGAYSAYKEISQSQNLSTAAKIDIAWIFKEYGYPEISLRVLDEVEPTLKLPAKYWLFRSICQVLTENKAQAMDSCNRAKSAAKEKGEGLQEVLSHTGALLMRYQKEGDRLLQNAIEYDNEFPAQKAITKLNINDEKDQKFIRDSMIQRKQWFESILNIYLNNPLPVYTLEKSFKRPFIEIWEGRGANFPWEFHIPSEDYQKHLIGLLEGSDELIFDYISLLTLVKSNLLGFAERINKKMYVHKLTFDKVQNELIQCESKTLRKLWDYLRKSSQIQIIAPDEKLDKNLKKVSNIFEPWLLQTIQVAKSKNYLFVTDDLRLSKVITNEGVKVINSFTFLIYAQDKKWIEKRDYSQILGEISDCVYSFLPFNFEDLHEIIWQDDYKLTRRSYHLIHQLLLPGSGAISFIGVFIDFIRELWRSGALSEDKIFWIKFITDEINLLFQKWEKENLPATDEQKEFINKFALMWGTAVQIGNLDDLKALRSELVSIPTDSLVYKIKESIEKHIELRMQQMESKTS